MLENTALALPDFADDDELVTRGLERLLAERDAQIKHLIVVAQIAVDPGLAEAFRTFAKVAFSKDRSVPKAEDLFDVAAATKRVDASYWDRALDEYDLRSFMPDARRQEWQKQIDSGEAAPFERDAAYATISELLRRRLDFLAEMVDGVFRGLSGKHVTNKPQAFSERMIVDYVFNSYDTVESHRAGLFHDLRCVVARKLERDQPAWWTSRRILESARRQHGEWLDVDGGAFRVRCYLKGTMHLEVQPDVAAWLNRVLAHLHPTALADANRRREKPRQREVKLLQRLVPEPVRQALGDLRYDGNVASLDRLRLEDKHLRRAVHDVLEALGGAQTARGEFTFDYQPQDVVEQVQASGALPDERSHQFYPTPPAVAAQLVELLDVRPGMRCLEPSAGQGAIAMLLPDCLVAVETSPVNHAVLLAKLSAAGRTAEVVCADFLAWPNPSGRAFDRVAMNPPFSEGRAMRHVGRAWKHLAPGGKLGAVLPASLRDGPIELPGMTSFAWHDPVEQFKGVSIDVAILIVDCER